MPQGAFARNYVVNGVLTLGFKAERLASATKAGQEATDDRRE
jgi:hypothetical protein